MAGIGKMAVPPYWAYFGKRLVELAEIPEGAWVLDVGSGRRGTSLLPAATTTGPQGQVIGIDNWEECVRGTSLEIKARGLGNAIMVWMDATRPGFRPNSFDYMLSGFAICWFSLRDIFPLLRAGGRVAFSSWAWQEDSEWMGALVGRLIPDPGSTDGRPRAYNLDTAELLKDVLDKAGYRDIRVLREDEEFVYRDEEEWWGIMERSGWQSLLDQIKNMGAGVLEKLKEDAFRMLQTYKDAEGVHYTRSVLFALGTK